MRGSASLAGVCLQRLWRASPSLPPAEGRARGKAGPTWLSVGIDLQHEVGDQVKVKDALIVGLLGRTGQGVSGGVSTAQGHSKAPSAGSKRLTWTACPGLGARSLLWAPSGACSGHKCRQFPCCAERTHSPFPLSRSVRLTSNRIPTRFLWTKLPHAPGSSNPSGSEQELL